MNEVEVEFRQKLAKTENSLKQVEYDKALLEKKLEALEASSKQTIERLQNDKIKLELNLIQLESQLRENHQEKENLILAAENQQQQHQQQQQQKNNQLLQPPLNKNSSSSSSLSSLPNNSSLTSRSNNNDDSIMLSNCIRTAVEALSHVYSSLEERDTLLKPFLSNGPHVKFAAKCEQSLVGIESKFRHGKVDAGTLNMTLVDEFVDSNRRLLQATIAELGVSTSVSLGQSTSSASLATPSEEMDKLHKKLKIYLNKIDAFLFDSNAQVRFNLPAM